MGFCPCIRMTIILLCFVALLLLAFLTMVKEDLQFASDPEPATPPNITKTIQIRWQPPIYSVAPETMAQLQLIVERDKAREGSCQRQGIVLPLRLVGDPLKCMALTNVGCEASCFLVNSMKEAQGLYVHAALIKVPPRLHLLQKVIVMGLEPRPETSLWNLGQSADACMTYNLDCNLPQVYARQGFYNKTRQFPIPSAEDFRAREFMLFVSSNCKRHRKEMISELSRQNITIHARGKCMNNAPMIRGGKEDALPSYAQYRFFLAIEKVIDQDYVSEKFFYGFMGNTIPVYYGSRVARIYQPWNGSYIDMREFPDLPALAAYLLDIGNDYDKWAQFFMGRTEPIATHQLHFDKWTTTHPQGLCRVCDCLCNETCSSQYSAGEGINWPGGI